jgi:hypothetical protein
MMSNCEFAVVLIVWPLLACSPQSDSAGSAIASIGRKHWRSSANLSLRRVWYSLGDIALPRLIVLA